jgi:serine protease Do
MFATFSINIYMRYLLLLIVLIMPFSVSAHRESQAQTAFLDLIDVTKESVVFVVNTPFADTKMTGPARPFKKLDPEDLPEIGPNKNRKHMGTGFIVEGGYIITNWHVIENAKEIEVYFETSDQSYAVELVASDKEIDIAVLKPSGDFPEVAPLQWRSTPIRQGEEVFAIGHPLGFMWSVTKGIISHLDRRIASPWQPTIQTDAAINQGNSGGPLLDMDGKVLAINVMIIAPSGGFQGIALAIDHATAQRAIVTLLEDGEISRPLMGVMLEFDYELLKVKAVSVTVGSGGELGGMKAGDFYVEMDGHPIKEMNDIFDVLALKVPGDDVTVKVLRDGKLVTLVVTLKGLPAS